MRQESEDVAVQWMARGIVQICLYCAFAHVSLDLVSLNHDLRGTRLNEF